MNEKEKLDLVGFGYGLCLIMTCMLTIIATVAYIGGICDGLTFAEGFGTGLGFFKVGFKLFEIETR